MSQDQSSNFQVVWSVRRAGAGRSERRFADFVVNGVVLSEWVGRDVVSVFGWGARQEQVLAADRLLCLTEPDLPRGRVSLYVCPECGDPGCGALSVVIEERSGSFVWRDFAFQNNYDGEVHDLGCVELGPLVFDSRMYRRVIDALRASIEGGA
jgi:hypothetical protein